MGDPCELLDTSVFAEVAARKTENLRLRAIMYRSSLKRASHGVKSARVEEASRPGTID